MRNDDDPEDVETAIALIAFLALARGGKLPLRPLNAPREVPPTTGRSGKKFTLC
jgi:hypothetical protein